MRNKTIKASKKKAEKLAKQFGVSQETVDSFKYQDEKLGKVLNIKDNPDEPVLPCVKEKDVEVGGIAVERLRSLIERIERLQEETKAIASDIRDIFAEAKSAGFDVKVMREIMKQRKMNTADREERDYLLETYKKALEM